MTDRLAVEELLNKPSKSATPAMAYNPFCQGTNQVYPNWVIHDPYDFVMLGRARCMHANTNMSGTFLIKDGPTIECGKGKRLVEKGEAETRL